MKLDKLLEDILWEIEAAGKDCPESLRQFEEKIKKAIYIQSNLVSTFGRGEQRMDSPDRVYPLQTAAQSLLIARMNKKEDMKMSKEQELQWKVDYLKESLKQIKATIVGVKMGYVNKDWVDGKMMDSFCDLIDNSLFNSK